MDHYITLARLGITIDKVMSPAIGAYWVISVNGMYDSVHTSQVDAIETAFDVARAILA